MALKQIVLSSVLAGSILQCSLTYPMYPMDEYGYADVPMNAYSDIPFRFAPMPYEDYHIEFAPVPVNTYADAYADIPFGFAPMPFEDIPQEIAKYVTEEEKPLLAACLKKCKDKYWQHRSISFRKAGEYYSACKRSWGSLLLPCNPKFLGLSNKIFVERLAIRG